MEGEGLGEVGESEGNVDTDEGTGTLFLSISLHYSFSSVLFLISQVFSASSPPPPVQTGKDLPLNDFSWASPALMLFGLRL